MRTRNGFTLVEVMVALVVSAIVLLGARQMFEGVADQAHRIVASAAETDRDANAERLLRELVGRLEVGTGEGTEFAGDPASASFASWCEVSAGWEERCHVTLTIESDSGRGVLLLRTSAGDSIRLSSGFHEGAISYLSAADAGGTWMRLWGVGITAPLALRIVIGRDTLFVPIGERG